MGEPTKCWWATDTNVSGMAVGLLTWVMWDIYEWYLLCHCGAVLRGHLDYGSMSYDLGLGGTSMCGICLFYGGAVP